MVLCPGVARSRMYKGEFTSHEVMEMCGRKCGSFLIMTCNKWRVES